MSQADEEWEPITCRMPVKLKADEKAKVLASTSLNERSPYFDISCCPITHAVEQRMEQVSTTVSKENYNDFWGEGCYHCARCAHALYGGDSKFVGPCMWPSFRKGYSPDSLHATEVPRGSYNEYVCDVHELYCGKCQLFLGHQFADGVACGDTHPEAGQRHCVLSLSLNFAARPVAAGSS